MTNKYILLYIILLILQSCNKVHSIKDEKPVKVPQYPNSIIIHDQKMNINEEFYEFKSSDDKDEVFEWYIDKIPTDWILYDSRDNNFIKFSKKTECFYFTIIIDYIVMINIVSDRYEVSSSVNNRCR